jgi:hypothetical protein
LANKPFGSGKIDRRGRLRIKIGIDNVFMWGIIESEGSREGFVLLYEPAAQHHCVGPREQVCG